MDPILSFDGENRWLSNFDDTPFELPGIGVVKGVERPFQALKVAHDLEARDLILNAETPGKAKRMGSKTGLEKLSKELRRPVVLRADWEWHTPSPGPKVPAPPSEKVLRTKEWVMLWLLRHKFQVPKLRENLLGTELALLVEGNRHGDTFWGVCEGRGQSRLGFLQMEVRWELRQRP